MSNRDPGPAPRPPVETRDLLAVIVCPLGLALMLISAVLAADTAPLWTGLLLAGVVLAFGGYYLGTRKV